MIEEIQNLLKYRFYEKLLCGKISEARAVSELIIKRFNELKREIAQYAQTIKAEDAQLANELSEFWKSIQSMFYEWAAAVNDNLSNLSEEDFKSDPNTGKTLLQDAFKEKTERLCQSLEDMGIIRQKVDRALAEKRKIAKLLKIKYTKKYEKLKYKHKTYSQHINEIDSVEQRIVAYLVKGRTHVSGVTQEIQTGIWAGYLHADLPKPINNHRIVYSWDSTNKIVTFETIGTHDELGIKSR